MKIQVLIIFLLFQLSFSQQTNYTKFRGFRILADVLIDIPDIFDELDCADNCTANGASCIGFRWFNNECQLLTLIRNIVLDEYACGYYIVDMRREHAGNQLMAELNETDKYVYAVAYQDKSACPLGFIDNITTCTIEADETKCNEYADFYKTTYVGSECVITAIRLNWYCAFNLDNANIYFSTAFDGYCYFKVSTPTTKSISSFNQQCQSTSSKSALLSICSRKEKDFVASITTEWPTFLSLYISSTQTSRVYNWTDASIGGYCDYRSWHSLNATTSEDEPNDYTTNTETIIGMADDKKFYDYSVAEITPSTIICQEEALSLEDYSANCETIDGCAQLSAQNDEKDEL